jgi:hypothetical protein
LKQVAADRGIVIRVLAPYLIHMPVKLPNADAIFRVFQRTDQTFAIEVEVPDSSPTTVSSFPSEQAAELWIAKFKERVETAGTRGRYFRGRKGG